MRRRRITALAAAGHRARANRFAKIDHCDEAVAARAVPFFRVRIRPRRKRSERTPQRRSEFHGNAGLGVVEMRFDIVIESLKAVDLAPRRFPRAEIRSKPVRRIGERLQKLRGWDLRRSEEHTSELQS